MIALSAGAEISFGGEITMNTDKIYAEAIANEYAPKEASKVLALKKLDMKAKSKANIFAYTFGVVMVLVLGTGMCLSMGVKTPLTSEPLKVRTSMVFFLFPLIYKGFRTPMDTLLFGHSCMDPAIIIP